MAHLALAAPAVAAAPPPGAKVVQSMAEIRNAGVVRQAWDLTCGAAAIATVMTYQLGRPVSERQVALAMLRRSSPLAVRARLGFSLLDLKLYAADQGLTAAGYGEMTLADLDRMAPAIVPIRQRGYDHFVVYRGRSDDRVLIADPSFGNRTLPADIFERMWATRVGFIVFDPAHRDAPNRMAAPRELFPTPGVQAERAVIDGLPSTLVAAAGRAP